MLGVVSHGRLSPIFKLKILDMNELAKNLWAFFLASLFFGIWIIPILIVIFAIYTVVYIKWPDFFRKYM